MKLRFLWSTLDFVAIFIAMLVMICLPIIFIFSIGFALVHLSSAESALKILVITLLFSIGGVWGIVALFITAIFSVMRIHLSILPKTIISMGLIVGILSAIYATQLYMPSIFRPMYYFYGLTFPYMIISAIGHLCDLYWKRKDTLLE